MKNTIRFGVSATKITPPLGTCLAGYFTKREASGVHDDLFAKALYLGKGASSLIVISCDVVGIVADLARSLRQDISAKTGVPVDSILVCATHTHTGPIIESRRDGPVPDDAYLADLKSRIVSAAVAAADSAKDGRVDYGRGVLWGYAFNRRYRMRDGSVMTNPGLDNPDVVEPAGPVDESVNVLKFTNEAGTVEAVMVNAGLHPDTVSGNMISADWPGYLARKVTERFPDATVLVLNGTQGDINSFDVMGGRLVQNIDEAVRIGEAYGARVIEICERAQPLPVDGLAGRVAPAMVPGRCVADAELEAARQLIREYGEEYDIEKTNRTLESQDIARGDLTVKVFFAKKLVAVHEEYAGKEIEIMVSALRIGDLALLGVGGELFTRLGLALKQESPFSPTLVAVCANGYNGYIPSRQEYLEGGYEVMSTKFSPSVGDIVLQAGLKLLREMKSA